MRRSIQTLAALTLAVLSVGAQTRTVIQSRIDRLHQLFDEQWEYTLRNGPEFASILGEKRYNDKLSDFSQEAVDRNLAKTREHISRDARRRKSQRFVFNRSRGSVDVKSVSRTSGISTGCAVFQSTVMRF